MTLLDPRMTSYFQVMIVGIDFEGEVAVVTDDVPMAVYA